MFTKALPMSYTEPVNAAKVATAAFLRNTEFCAPDERPARLFRLGGWLPRPELVLFFAAQALFPVTRTDDGLLDFDNCMLQIARPELLGNVLFDLREYHRDFFTHGAFRDEGEVEDMFKLHHAFLSERCPGLALTAHNPRNTADPLNGTIVPRRAYTPPDDAAVARAMAAA